MNDPQKNMRELETLRDELDDACARIAHQIDMAKARSIEGDYSDPVWFQRTVHALRMKRKLYNRTLQEISFLKKDQRRKYNSSTERFFVSVAKRRLDRELFTEIMDEANDMADLAKSGNST